MVSTCFDLAAVMTAFSSQIGFRNPTLSGYDIVDAGNQTSASGRYFDDAHPAVTIQNIKDTQEDLNISDADFNTLLTNFKKGNIAEALNAVFAGESTIDTGLLFEKRVDNYQPQPRSLAAGTVCGVRVRIAHGNYAVGIDSAQLLFDANATFSLYLMQEHKAAPLATISVTVVANELKIVNVAQILNNISATNKGGDYYLCFFVDDLGGARPLEYAPDWQVFKVFNALAFTAPATGATTFNRFQLNTSYANFGLNVQFSSYRDYTAKIIAQAGQFDRLQSLMMAYKVINQILNTNRSNVTERIGRENAIAWNNDANAIPVEGVPYSPSLKWKITQEVKRLQKMFAQRSKSQNVTYGTCN